MAGYKRLLGDESGRAIRFGALATWFMTLNDALGWTGYNNSIQTFGNSMILFSRLILIIQVLILLLNMTRCSIDISTRGRMMLGMLLLLLLLL